GLDRVLAVFDGASLKLAGATLTGGAPVPALSPIVGGGALLNRGTATLSHVTMEHNSVGGKNADDSAVASNWGALTITDSTVAENDRAPGSQGWTDGVLNGGTLVLRRTVLRDGIADLRNLGSGVATVVGGQISGNVGTAVTNDGSMQLTRTTISG